MLIKSFRRLIGRVAPLAPLALLVAAAPGFAQSFRVQCPTSTPFHNSTSSNPGAIKCQQISGGDGYATMADGTQTYMFSFGPLSGLQDIANGRPGTEPAGVFNVPYDGPSLFDPTVTYSGTSPNGAVGLIPDLDANTVVGTFTINAISETGTTVTVTTTAANGLAPGANVNVSGAPAGYNGLFTVATVDPTTKSFTYSTASSSGVSGLSSATSGTVSALNIPNTGHVDPRPIMNVGVMNGNIPAPMMAIDEDDEFFLTLTNVGMIMRPDLFEQHTVHFHGYPNASAFYDGVPDASVAINIGGSFTYYYLAPDAGTYFWHCHITPPEHLQMGMVGQLYVRPRQNRVPASMTLYQGLVNQQSDLRSKCDSNTDILCSNPLPAVLTTDTGGGRYAYNDGDGSTRYDVEYPIQIHGFDPNFHFVGMTFNPEPFTDMKDKYFLLNGRSYPDTVGTIDSVTHTAYTGAMQTPSADGVTHFSQPLSTVVNIPAGGRALLRVSDLDVSEYQTLASLGIPMKVIGYNAKLLRDQAGNNMYYTTNSITLAGGESVDVILDASVPKPDGTAYAAGEIYYLYTPNLDHLSNDAENFGGLMTEVHIL
jgi:hypothetical protein